MGPWKWSENINSIQQHTLRPLFFQWTKWFWWRCIRVFHAVPRIYVIHSFKLVLRTIRSSNICLQPKYPHSAPNWWITVVFCMQKEENICENIHPEKGEKYIMSHHLYIIWSVSDYTEVKVVVNKDTTPLSGNYFEELIRRCTLVFTSKST